MLPHPLFQKNIPAYGASGTIKAIFRGLKALGLSRKEANKDDLSYLTDVLINKNTKYTKEVCLLEDSLVLCFCWWDYQNTETERWVWTMTTIYSIEDEESLISLLEYNITSAGYKFDHSVNGYDGMMELQKVKSSKITKRRLSGYGCDFVRDNN